MGEGGRNIDGLDDGEEASRRGGSPQPGATVHRLRGVAGGLEVPPGLAGELGLEPGVELVAVSRDGRVELRPNIHSLARLYVEPTARCNLSCATCVRNTWQEPLGDMSPGVLERLLAALGRFPHLRSVMLGGFGEPTLHPDIVAMIRGFKHVGLRVEMVSNGTLLEGTLAAGIAAGGLDVLWVSFDGASGPCHESIREGASHAGVIANVRRLRQALRAAGRELEIGIAFVVTRSNVDDLRQLDRLVEAVGASRVSVSNVLPYSAAMEKEMVCRVSLALELLAGVPGKVEISLPRLDVNDSTREAILGLLRGHANLSLMGNPVRTEIQSCRFVRERCTFVRWDGRVSPCMGLLHAHTTFLHGNQRAIEPYFVGDVAAEDLLEIWSSEDYRSFRERVDAFDFSPCHACGGCTLADANAEDCLGSGAPTCGGCLWAQGIIQCP